MKALTADSHERARRMSPEEKATRTFELIEAGFALKKAGLRARNPGASESEIDAMFADWLAHR
jgi:hypothetical protein